MAPKYTVHHGFSLLWVNCASQLNLHGPVGWPSLFSSWSHRKKLSVPCSMCLGLPFPPTRAGEDLFLVACPTAKALTHKDEDVQRWSSKFWKRLDSKNGGVAIWAIHYCQTVRIWSWSTSCTWPVCTGHPLDLWRPHNCSDQCKWLSSPLTFSFLCGRYTFLWQDHKILLEWVPFSHTWEEPSPKTVNCWFYSTLSTLWFLAKDPSCWISLLSSCWLLPCYPSTGAATAEIHSLVWWLWSSQRILEFWWSQGLGSFCFLYESSDSFLQFVWKKGTLWKASVHKGNRRVL